MRLALAVLVAALCVPLAIALAVVAADVLRTPGELATADRRFQSAPTRDAAFWDVGFLPGNASERLLGIEDDVDYRELAALYVAVEPGKVDVEGSAELEPLRSQARSALARLSDEERNPERRSRALTLYGVLTLDRLPIAKGERRQRLDTAVSAFRSAIELDPSNTDAMSNLEAVLERFGEVVADAS
jgi:hypothetical protein